MINDLKNVSIPSMLYGTCVNPIRVTSAQLDKTWKPGVYICYMSIPSITDDYKQDLLVEVINYEDQDGCKNICQRCEVPGQRVCYRTVYNDNVSDYSEIFNNGNKFYEWRIPIYSHTDRCATVIVAASNSSNQSKYGADYVCTGSDDYKIIQQAIDSLSADGGKVLLLEGTYSISNTINITQANTTIEGMGDSTKIICQYDISGSVFNIQYDHCEFKHFYISEIGTTKVISIFTTSKAINYLNVDNINMGCMGMAFTSGKGGNFITFTNCQIFGDTGIYMASNVYNYVNIHNCNIGTDSIAITLYGHNCIISNNYINGIVLSATSTNNIISNNLVKSTISNDSGNDTNTIVNNKENVSS